MPMIMWVWYTEKNGQRLTLEQGCLRSGTLSSIACGYKKRSLKRKVALQEEFCRHCQPCTDTWEEGEKVAKFIGYDVGEERRLLSAPPHDLQDKKYQKEYPLMEWGWSRKDRIQAIRDVGLPLPGKSPCFFCPSMKWQEIQTLYHRYSDLLRRALAIEDTAMPNLISVWGSGRNWAWRDFICVDENQLAIPGTFSDEDPPCSCCMKGELSTADLQKRKEIRMKKIELKQWEPLPGDPRRMRYAGQCAAQEVLEELKYRLESMGYLPDEHFLMDREWENGREIPKDADIFRTTGYGGNEGVYLDVYPKWYKNSRPVTKNFIIDKTLGEIGTDLDRIFLISSVITKAFYGDDETYVQHLRQGEQMEPEGMIVHLNLAEQRTTIKALAEQQERQEQAMPQTEQLPRQMTGSITAYMDEVGRYSLRISDYDKTVLAVRDEEFDAFKNLYPRVLDQTDDLLIEVAGRPGVVGGNMTLIFLAAVERSSPEAYLTARKRAMEAGDSWRVQTLVKESEGRLPEPFPLLHGEVILYTYTNNCWNIARDLIAQCMSGQIASVSLRLLRWVTEKLDFQTTVDLVDKGVRPGDEVASIPYTLTGRHQEWTVERLLEHGMPVELGNYDAFYACVSNQAAGAAKLPLDRGIDLEQCQLWTEHRPEGDGYTEAMEELVAYWSELQSNTQPEDSSMKGMDP